MLSVGSVMVAILTCNNSSEMLCFFLCVPCYVLCIMYFINKFVFCYLQTDVRRDNELRMLRMFRITKIMVEYINHLTCN